MLYSIFSWLSGNPWFLLVSCQSSWCYVEWSLNRPRDFRHDLAFTFHIIISHPFIYLFGTFSRQSPKRNCMCCRSLRACYASLMRRVNPSDRVKSTFISVCRCSWIPPALTAFPSQPKMATGTPHPKIRGHRLPSLITPARWVTGSYTLGCAHAELSVMCSAGVPHFTHKHQCIVRSFRETLLRVNMLCHAEREGYY